MGLITWLDKIGVIPKQTRINQVWDDDMNEIKAAINDNHKIIDGFFVPTTTLGRQTWVVGDMFFGNIGDRIVGGIIKDDTAVLPADIDTAKVGLAIDSEL